MKKILSNTFILSMLLGTLVITTGCGPKTVVPPQPSDGTTGSGMTGGNDINYPAAQGSGGYSEENLPTEGTLDDSTGATGLAGGAGVNADQQSDEYKKAHGRSSANLAPIYFEFDQAGVRPDMTEILISNSDYLNAAAGVPVVIEGNCDERGTNEYNLALGERRAINTQQYLINLGVDPSRMRTVSYGEEKPLFQGQDEEAYKYNRRVDFVVE